MRWVMSRLEVKYDSVADDLRKRILCGEFVSGLPGVKKLALEYGVNFMTVDKALNCLERENLVYRLPRQGTFVRCRRNILLAICDSNEKLLENSFYAPLITGIQQRLLEENCFMLSCNLYGMSKRQRENLLRRVDGTLAINGSTVKLCAETGKPVIRLLGEEEEPVRVDHFTYCSKKIGTLAADYLFSSGARKPGYAGFNDCGIFNNRRCGFIEQCQLLKVDAEDASCLFDRKSEHLAVLSRQLEKLLQAGCDGIFAGSDSSAITVSTILALRGIYIPVIGCNNSPLRQYLSRECVPATISLNVRTIGSQAAQRLLQRIDGANFPPQQFLFEPKIIDKDNFTEE